MTTEELYKGAEIFEPSGVDEDGYVWISKVVASESTLPSVPVTAIDIPEPSEQNAKFVYNFFMKDESISSDGGSIHFDPTTSPLYEKRLYGLKDTVPRLVTLSWKMPAISLPGTFPIIKAPKIQDTKPSPASSYGKSRTPNTISIKQNMKSLMFEEAVTNGNFSAVHIKDDDLDGKFYNLISGTMETFSPVSLWEVVTNQAGTNKAYTRSSFVNQDEPLSEQVIKSLGNIQGEGYEFISEKRSDNIASTFFGPKSVEIDFSVNNKIAGSLLRNSSESSLGAFTDEISSLSEKARNVSAAAIQSSSPGIISLDDYTPTVTPIDVFGPISTYASSAESPYNEDVVLIGYYIEKREITASGKIIDYEPIIVENPDKTELFDTSIKYGSAYSYKIRAVTLAQFEALQVASDSGTVLGVYVARVMIASRGVTAVVNCVDNIPPNPPSCIEFNYNYDKDNLMFSWSFPLNPERDVKKFQVFKRRSINEPFSLECEYDFDDSMFLYKSGEAVDPRLIKRMKNGSTFYIDSNFKKDDSPFFIYAVVAIDAHGLTSNYSEQVSVSFDAFKNRIVLNRVSQSGAPKPYPNLYLQQDLFQDCIKNSGSERISIFLDPEYMKLYNEKGDDLNLVATDSENPSYYMTILNCDLQKSKVIDIHIDDQSNQVSEPVQSLGVEIKTLGLDSDTGSRKEYDPTPAMSTDWREVFGEAKLP